MPIARIQMPDGRIARFEVPPDWTPEQIEQFAMQGSMAATTEAPQEDIASQQQAILERMSGDFGEIVEEGGEGAGISLGEAITSAPYRAAFGKRLVEIGRGVKQLFASPEEAERIAQTSKEEERTIEERLAQFPEEKAAFELGGATATLGEAGLLTRYIPSPSAIGLGGRGLKPALGRIGYGGAVGGGVAATTPTQPGQSKAEQVGMGALLGGGISAGVESVSALARPFVSLFTTKAEAAKAGGIITESPAFERGKALQKETGVRLTPGQLTGSAALSEMLPPREFTNAQAKETLRYFKKVRDTVSKQAKPAPELAQRLDEATEDIYNKLIRTRKFVGDFRYEKFKKSVKEVYIDKLRSKMDEIADDAIPGTDEGKIIGMRDKLVKQIEETGDSLTIEQFLGWKQRIDALLVGKSDIFKDLTKANQKRLGNQLMDALYEDLAITAEFLGKQGKESPANLLKKAVSDYRKFSGPLKELEDSALGAIFKTDKLTPDQAAKKLMSLDPSQVSGIYRILERRNPNLIREYQATKLYEAMKAGVRLTPETAGRGASETKFNPKAVLRELSDKRGLRAIFSKDPELMRRVNNGIALLDRASDRLTIGSGGKQGLASKESELARNAMSGNSIFIAGTAAKYLGPVGLWKLTTTQGGINTLKILATAPVNSPKFIAATQSLINDLDDVEEE